jgi:FkbM family methyltransferase
MTQLGHPDRAREIDEDVVRLAYLLLLGREVESQEALRQHLALRSVAELRQAIMSSPEFMAQRPPSPVEAKWVSADVLGRFTLWLDLSDRHVSSACLHEDWEPGETKFMASRLRSGDVVLDVGANIGWFSLLAAKFIGKNGLVHAFEPRPDTVAMLKRTIADNGLREQVMVWEMALADHWGSSRLYWEKGADNPGFSFIEPLNSEAVRGHESVAVKLAVLDELLPEIAPDFIKIDVEGAEPQVLSGSRQAIMRRRPVILSELYPKGLQDVAGVTAAQYIDFLRELGYSCYFLEDDGRPTHKLKDFPPECELDNVSIVCEYEGIRA